MRLWHQNLIHYLDDKRLLGQHRECCALRGKGWGKKHSVVNYVFDYDMAYLFQYHLLVMKEMSDRHFKIDPMWYNRSYRRKNMSISNLMDTGSFDYVSFYDENGKPLNIIYKEHDDDYLKECLLNLKAKNAQLINGKNIEQMLIELELNP
jgi:uncharacterized protein (TIGR02328 family)